MSVNHEREEKKVDENQRSYANIALFQLLMFRGVPGLFRARPLFRWVHLWLSTTRQPKQAAAHCVLLLRHWGQSHHRCPPRAALRQPGGRGRPTRRGCRDEKSAGGSGPREAAVLAGFQLEVRWGQRASRGSGFLEATAPTDVGNVPSVGAVMLCAPFPPSVRRGCWLREGSTFPFLSSAGHPGSA